MDFFKNRNPVPHFVFLDINMPLVDGIECLKGIRRVHPPGNLPVIMLSTSRSAYMVEQSYSNGASFYLQKPNQISELADQLKFCLDHLTAEVPIKNHLFNS